MKVESRPVEYEVVCPNCLAVLSFNLYDISSVDLCVTCPDCYAKIQVAHKVNRNKELLGNVRAIYRKSRRKGNDV